MVHYKLMYFNLRGRAEVARLILHHAEVPFEDFRFERAEWPALKSQMPFGQCPVLEVDGKQLAQSNTICRYLAKQHGLAGKDDWETALADMYGDCYQDLIGGMKPIIMENDPDKKKELFLKYNTDTIQPHLQKIEAHLVKNGTGFLVGDSVTWADLAYYSILVPMAEMHGEELILGSTPHVKKLCDQVGDIPQIKKWVESRPKTAI